MARLPLQYGHEPRLMAANFLALFRMADKSGKNDAADDQAIYEVICRPHISTELGDGKHYASSRGGWFLVRTAPVVEQLC